MVESQVTCQYCEIRDFENCMFNRQPFQSNWLSGCVESEMGNCYMCDKPAVFIAHDLPTGEKSFCSELHYCQYAGAPYHGEGYYGFTDSAKVKEPARIARARKRLKYAESFSAEKVKKEILEDDEGGLVMKFIYKDREGKLEWSDNEDGKGGVLSFGDNPFKPYDIKIGRRMSRLPHSKKIEDIRSKLEAKEVFKIMMDKPCQSCGDAIHKKGIGSCGWCESDYGMRMKFDPNKDIKDNKWWDRQSETRKIFLWDELTNKNPYCRDCLYYYGYRSNYPSAFDKESANYYLANAVCEKHWDEIVAEGKLSKDSKRYSLYKIENVSPRERMMKQRFGLGAETFEADTNQWKVGDKVRIIGNSGGYHGFDIGEIVTLVIEYPINNGWWAMVNDDTPIKEQLVSLKDVELYVQPNTNPRKARLKKRFGLGAETFEAPRNCALCGVSGHNRRTCPTKGINPFSNGDTIICKKDAGGRYKVFIIDDLAKYTESPNGEIILAHPNGLKTEFDDIDDVKTYFEVFDPTDEKWHWMDLVIYGKIKEYEERFGSLQLTKQKYIPKYKVGDILMVGGGDERIEIVRVDEETGSYYRLHRGGQGTVKMDIKRIDDSPDFELYIPYNPRKARLKKRFGLGAENEYVKTGVASLVVVSLLGFALFKRN